MSGSQFQAATTEFEAMISLPELIPPPGARPVGVFDDGSPTGKIIYEQKVLDVEKTVALRRPRLGPDGEPMIRRNAAGIPQQIVYELPVAVWRVRRGILMPFRNKKVKFVERFEESPQDIREREERKMVEGFSSDLAKQALAAGFKNAGDFVAALLGRHGQPTGQLEKMTKEADELLATGGVGMEEEQAGPAPAAEAPRKGKRA